MDISKRYTLVFPSTHGSDYYFLFNHPLPATYIVGSVRAYFNNIFIFYIFPTFFLFSGIRLRLLLQKKRDIRLVS